MKYLTPIVLALACLCPFARCQEHRVPQEKAAQQDMKEVMVLAQTIQFKIKALQDATREANPKIQSAIKEMENGLRKLTTHLGIKDPNGQVLIEACFIELDEDEPEDSAEKHLKARWRNAAPLAVSASEKDLTRLKEIGNSISSPNILVLDGGDASISIVESKNFPYLDRIETGLYQMKTKVVRDGLTFKINAKITEDSGHKLIRIDSTLIMNQVVGTTPCETGALTIGSPVLSTRETEMRMALGPGKWSITPTRQFNGNEKKTLIIAIKATIL